MKLSSIRLQNFRCFEDTTIHLHEQLTVLVGGNGSGKTAVLDGLNNIIPPICSGRINENDQTFYSFNRDDVKSIARDEIRMDFILMVDEKNQIIIPTVCDRQCGTDKKLKSTFLFKNRQYNTLCDPYHDRDALCGLEFCAYYMAQRRMKKDIQIRIAPEATIDEVYNPSLDRLECFETTVNWFNSKESEEARRGMREENVHYRIPELEAVRHAVASILGNYDKPYTDKTPAELFIHKKGDPTPYRLSQLSDGYRTMLALAMDLARRMAVVNAENYAATGKSVLESPAIVLIDEVELHLHPSWQQRVLPDLMRTFSNTQFIVTTHSPQVISSVKPENVRILKDGQVVSPEHSTYGAESSRVLDEIFGVNTRINEVHLELDAYFRMINNGQHDFPEAQELRSKFEDWLYNDPALTRADMLIERMERRKARENDHA